MKDWFELHFLRYTRTTRLHPLQKAAIAGLVLLIGLSLIQSILTPTILVQTDRMLSAVLPSVIVELTNRERSSESLGTLKRSALLDEAARRKGEDMKEKNYFAHYSPEGLSPWYWFDDVTYDFVYAGENLAVYFDDSKDVVKAWMKSPLHKENILKKEYTEIGVAVVEGEYDGYSTYFVVQLFGTPASAPIAKKVEVTTKLTTPPTSSITPPVTTVLSATEVQEELPEREENVTPEEKIVLAPESEVVTEAQQTEPENSTVPVERVQIDGNTVYVSDHISTTTVISAGVTDTTPEELGATVSVDTKIMLQMVYAGIVLLVVGFLLSSILFAEKRMLHIQALYGVVLLFVTVALVAVHAHVVTATTLL